MQTTYYQSITAATYAKISAHINGQRLVMKCSRKGFYLIDMNTELQNRINGVNA
ncbi:hypothetical protein ACOI22_03545 [Glaciecola sp. 2405UD65-10]|uniref:hypothetical protein n=1 Tax=Glaciecola sp. 2405UD65-10 TaxID=3397244 RepID=UPI003B5CA306